MESNRTESFSKEARSGASSRRQGLLAEQAGTLSFRNLECERVMRRVVLDVASQALPVATTILDRVLLTSILVRGLGVERFEYWSLAIAAAGLLAIVDSGCLMNFSNLVARHVERGDHAKAVAVYRQSNTIFTLLGLLATLIALVLAASPSLQQFAGVAPGPFAGDAFVVILALGAATALRLALSNLTTIYRVKLEFARGTALNALADLLRIFAVATAVASGGGLREAALAHLLATFAGLSAIAIADAGARHRDFRFALSTPRGPDLSGSVRNSLAFGLPLIPFIAINQVPVLLLGGDTRLGSGAIALFVLMRTLANVAQTAIGKVFNVLAMEIARHALRGDDARARALLTPLGRLSAVVFGICAGTLIGLGSPLTILWTGEAELYDHRVIALLMAPMIIAPAYLLSRAYVQYRNTPLIWTVGAFAHVALALLIYFLFERLDPVIRISLALSLGEILALSIPLTVAAMGGWKPRVLLEQAANTAIALASLAATVAVCRVAELVGGASSFAGIALALGTIAAIGGVALLAFGVPCWRAFQPVRASAGALDPSTRSG